MKIWWLGKSPLYGCEKKVQDELYFYIGLYIDSKPASSLDNAFIRVKAFLFDHDTAVES